ncbi:MAG TPA: BamA/TamA family outer membrane protein [Candidatus Eisenbacteria bacterium]|nr:BamA/TamA family outer membrane protein [Candidatus Eisenbacteria bacterium]
MRSYGARALAISLAAIAFSIPLHAAASDAIGSSPGDSLEAPRVTRVDVTGFRVTKEYVIRREIETAPGEPHDPADVAADVQRLENLGIFSSIDVVSSPDSAGVALEYQVREMPWLIPAIALSYTEQNGWSGGPSISTLNLAGRDIALSGKVLFGGSTTFSANLSYPWITGNHVGVDAYVARLVREDELNEFEERSTEMTPQLGTYLGRRGRLRAIYSSFRITSDVDGKTLSPDNEDHLHRIGGAIGYDSRNSWRDPTQGWWLELQTLRTGGRFLRGDGDFWTTDIDVRRYQPGPLRHSIHIASLLSLQSGEAGVDVPQYLLYRLGGANTIRGHDIDVLGKELYGKNQLLITTEYQIPVIDLREFRFFNKLSFSLGLKVALFADQGVAWSDGDDFGADRSRSGVGAGLRLLIPGADVLRFDFAYGEGGEWRFHLAGRPKMVSQRGRVR